MFRDREDAGRQLAGRLLHLRDEDPVVFGLPRGGVVVAAQVAQALEVPLDVLVVRKIGAPNQPELALGAVTEGEKPHQSFNDNLISAIGVDEAYLHTEAERQLGEVRRCNEQYRKGRAAVSVWGRTAIIVDDGIATGATMLAGIMGVRSQEPSRIVLAVPVAPPDALARMAPHVDESVCVSIPDDFMAVGSFYESFMQTTDEEVVRLLNQFQPANRK